VPPELTIVPETEAPELTTSVAPELICALTEKPPESTWRAPLTMTTPLATPLAATSRLPLTDTPLTAPWS
jgi:hypothetical protein